LVAIDGTPLAITASVVGVETKRRHVVSDKASHKNTQREKSKRSSSQHPASSPFAFARNRWREGAATSPQCDDYVVTISTEELIVRHSAADETRRHTLQAAKLSRSVNYRIIMTIAGARCAYGQVRLRGLVASADARILQFEKGRGREGRGRITAATATSTR